MLEVEQLEYPKRLRNLSFRVEPGTVVAITGDNGSGKTTLFRLLCGVLKSSSGKATWKGQSLFSLDRKALSRLVSWVPQGGRTQFPFTVEQFVAMGAYARSASQESVLPEAIWEHLGLKSFLKRGIGELSQGEQQRAYIARGIAAQTEILLLDEPTAFLDKEHRKRVSLLIRSLAKEGRTLLVATHDLELVSLCNQTINLSN